jgi:hypothetical protein
MVVIQDVIYLFHSDLMELLYFLFLYHFNFILRCFWFVIKRYCFFAAYLRSDNFCCLFSLAILFNQLFHVVVTFLFGLLACQLLYYLLLLFSTYSLKLTETFLTSAFLETDVFLLFILTLLFFFQHFKKLFFTILIDLNLLRLDFLLLLFILFFSLRYQK